VVFRDQHQREIQNYAIADGLIWNFTTARTEKIPLAVIDIPPRLKRNDDRESISGCLRRRRAVAAYSISLNFRSCDKLDVFLSF